MGLPETAWGKMFVMTVGSFYVFGRIVTLICVLHVKVNVSPKTLISIVSVQTSHFSLEGRYVRRLFVQNTEYNNFLSPKQIYPIHLHGFSWIFMYFHRFSWIFCDFLGFSFMDLHGFSLIYIDFHRFLLIFMDFHGFLWI